MNTPKRLPNATKWTEDVVKEHLIEMHGYAFDAGTLYLGRALIKCGLYGHVWSYWKRIFANNENILEAMYQIEYIFEARLFESALKKETSPWVAIFGLKNNHHWTDKHEPEAEEQEHNPLLIELADDTIMLVDSGRNDTYKLVERARLGIKTQEKQM